MKREEKKKSENWWRIVNEKEGEMAIEWRGYEFREDPKFFLFV